MLQDKALATKRPEMRFGWLASKTKLKGVRCKIEHRKVRLEI
jgi:hypothetical protein